MTTQMDYSEIIRATAKTLGTILDNYKALWAEIGSPSRYEIDFIPMHVDDNWYPTCVLIASAADVFEGAGGDLEIPYRAAVAAQAVAKYGLDATQPFSLKAGWERLRGTVFGNWKDIR